MTNQPSQQDRATYPQPAEYQGWYLLAEEKQVLDHAEAQ